jgi:UDP-2,3-diacylglucosamine pyrophosphatase LpxH
MDGEFAHLREALNGLVVRTSPDILLPKNLDPKVRREALDKLARIGNSFFGRLFQDENLKKKWNKLRVESLERARSGKPLSISIQHVSRVYPRLLLPFNLLYDGDLKNGVDPTNFWGYRFDVEFGVPAMLNQESELRLSTPIGVGIPSEEETVGPTQLEYEPQDPNQMWRLAIHRQRAFFNGLKPSVEVETFDDIEKFRDAFLSKEGKYPVLYLYGHSDGKSVSLDDSPTAKVLDIYDFNIAKNTIHTLSGHPLVIFNTCKGTAFESDSVNTFLNSLTDLGARGFLGTETYVGIAYAAEFAQGLLREFLKSRRPIGEVLFQLRRQTLEDPGGNPFVLLYTYYGNHYVHDPPAAIPGPSSSAENPTEYVNRKVIISDLHLGAGRAANGDWDPLEDFRHDADFIKFLEGIGHDGKTDLIIDGDFIDFWQLRTDLPEPQDPHLGPTENDSILRLHQAVTAHQETLIALGNFLRQDRNRLIIIPGNHDSDLYWPRVREELSKALRSSWGPKLIFAASGFLNDGSVYIEHGNQYDETNAFHHIPPIVEIDHIQRLETNWGNIFVRRFYNEIERQIPFVDNLYPEKSAVWLCVKREFRRGLALPAALDFLTLVLNDETAGYNLGFARATLGATPGLQHPSVQPSVDAALTAIEQNDRELARELRERLAEPDGPRIRSMQDAYLKELDKHQWDLISAALGEIRPPGTLSHAISDPYRQAAQRIVNRNHAIRVVVLAHSHDVESGTIRLQADSATWYVNSGCWVRVQNVSKVKDADWSKISLDDDRLFPARYTYVVVDYLKGVPQKPEKKIWQTDLSLAN